MLRYIKGSITANQTTAQGSGKNPSMICIPNDKTANLLTSYPSIFLYQLSKASFAGIPGLQLLYSFSGSYVRV